MLINEVISKENKIQDLVRQHCSQILAIYNKEKDSWLGKLIHENYILPEKVGKEIHPILRRICNN